MEDFESQKYRDNLAKGIRQEPDKEKRREIFKTAELTKDYREAKRSRGKEFELTSEQVEAIMRKIQDINQEGIGFHAIGAEKRSLSLANESTVTNILKNGLLGIPNEGAELEDTSPDNWAKNARARRDIDVDFNITGRFSDGDGTPKSAHYSHNTTILFDVSSFREQSAGRYGSNLRSHEYSAQDMDEGTFINKDRRGRPLPHSIYGFILKHRIAPRFFTGLVIGWQYRDVKTNIVDGKVLKEIIDSQKSAYSEHPENMLPIYDMFGNLLWPKQMNYDEVRRLAYKKVI